MHPVGLYLAIKDSHRDDGGFADDDRRVGFARVDAIPIAEPERVSRRGRLAAIVRRRVVRTAGA